MMSTRRNSTTVVRASVYEAFVQLGGLNQDSIVKGWMFGEASPTSERREGNSRPDSPSELSSFDTTMPIRATSPPFHSTSSIDSYSNTGEEWIVVDDEIEEDGAHVDRSRSTKSKLSSKLSALRSRSRSRSRPRKNGESSHQRHLFSKKDISPPLSTETENVDVAKPSSIFPDTAPSIDARQLATADSQSIRPGRETLVAHSKLPPMPTPTRRQSPSPPPPSSLLVASRTWGGDQKKGSFSATPYDLHSYVNHDKHHDKLSEQLLTPRNSTVAPIVPVSRRDEFTHPHSFTDESGNVTPRASLILEEPSPAMPVVLPPALPSRPPNERRASLRARQHPFPTRPIRPVPVSLANRGRDSCV
ncbi:hypothetical protein PM082_021438 [Marasmius tenuissimus]|nr:hypothetical protein PM082_021438 [Marasmius tenuissimus]